MRTSAHGRADLHVHTVWSDGAQRPEAIVNAVQGRLDVVAITDHDEIRGALRARERALARPELSWREARAPTSTGPGPRASYPSISRSSFEPGTDFSDAIGNASTWEPCRERFSQGGRGD